MRVVENFCLIGTIDFVSSLESWSQSLLAVRSDVSCVVRVAPSLVAAATSFVSRCVAM